MGAALRAEDTGEQSRSHSERAFETINGGKERHSLFHRTNDRDRMTHCRRVGEEKRGRRVIKHFSKYTLIHPPMHAPLRTIY